MQEGDLQPTANRIAARAGLSLRLIYHHFGDLESLFHAAAVRQTERLSAYIVPIQAGLPLAERVTAIVDQRADVLDWMTPVRLASLLQEPFSEELRSARDEMLHGGAAQVAEVFAPELAALPPAAADETLAALTTTLGWAFWNDLRTAGRSVAEPRAGRAPRRGRARRSLTTPTGTRWLAARRRPRRRHDGRDGWGRARSRGRPRRRRRSWRRSPPAPPRRPAAPPVLPADDGEHRTGARRGDRVEGLALGGALPLLRHPDHPVEGRGPVEATRAGGLQRVHAAHAEPEHPHRLAAGRLGRGQRVAEHAVVVEVADVLEAPVERLLLLPGPRLERADGPAGLVGQPGDVLVEQGPQATDVGDQHQSPLRRARWNDQLSGGAGRQGRAHGGPGDQWSRSAGRDPIDGRRSLSRRPPCPAGGSASNVRARAFVLGPVCRYLDRALAELRVTDVAQRRRARTGRGPGGPVGTPPQAGRCPADRRHHEAGDAPALAMAPTAYVEELLERAAALLKTLDHDEAGLSDDEHAERLRIEADQARRRADAHQARSRSLGCTSPPRRSPGPRARRRCSSRGCTACDPSTTPWTSPSWSTSSRPR